MGSSRRILDGERLYASVSIQSNWNSQSLGDCDDCEVDNLIFDVEEFEYDDGEIYPNQALHM